MVTIIAAVAANGVIGSKNDLPWYYPEDLKHFKDLTSGHPIVMGLNTFISLLAKAKKPLPNRPHFVLTSKSQKEIFALLQSTFPELELEKMIEGVRFHKHLSNALHVAEALDQFVFVIGGHGIFKEALQYANRLELTEINKNFEGDVYFPEFDRSKWERIVPKQAETPELTFAQYNPVIS